jgi:hypothetical protein
MISFASMNRRRRFALAFVPLLIGLMALVRVTTGPRFETYYKPDMLSLFAAGMCFGAAVALAAVALRGTSER